LEWTPLKKSAEIWKDTFTDSDSDDSFPGQSSGQSSDQNLIDLTNGEIDSISQTYADCITESVYDELPEFYQNYTNSPDIVAPTMDPSSESYDLPSEDNENAQNSLENLPDENQHNEEHTRKRRRKNEEQETRNISKTQENNYFNWDPDKLPYFGYMNKFLKVVAPDIIPCNKPEIFLGRSCEVVIIDLDYPLKTSRRHARIQVELENNQFNVTIFDLTSKRNGIFINGDLVEKQLLVPGDTVTFGEKTNLVYKYFDPNMDNTKDAIRSFDGYDMRQLREVYDPLPYSFFKKKMEISKENSPEKSPEKSTEKRKKRKRKIDLKRIENNYE